MIWRQFYSLKLAGHSILSISQVNNQVKYCLERDFSNVWIKGEVASCKPYPSGHIYLTLKDDSAEISAVIFSQYVKQLIHTPVSGMEVLVMGDLSLYQTRGQFQLKIKSLHLSGEGELWVAYERLKKKLGEEGLFDASVKKKIPQFPRRIGIITSLEGAALRDIIHILRRRAPHVKCCVYHVPVQGRTAAKKIGDAIDNMNQYGQVDLLIVGRGGGSMEDLWSFNEEIVVRSIYNSTIPIISAVGHETDTTLSDYAADYRASTPSAAAEVAAMHREEIIQKLDHLQNDLIQVVNQSLKSYSDQINIFQKRHTLFKPHVVLESWKEKLGEKSHQLKQHLNNLIQIKISQMTTITSKLDLLNPEAQLQRGYALALDENQQVIYSIKQVGVDDIFQLRLAQGKLSAKVLDKGNKNG